MLAFIAKRLGSGILLLGVISTLAYFLVFTTTDGVALRLLGDMATPEQLRAKEVELGLDRPIFERFLSWATHALQGDFGTSWFTSESIISSLANRLPVTITIVFVAIFVAAILAVILGMAAAIKGGWIDRMVQVVAIAGFAVPAFVVAIGLVFVFAVNWMLLPATGWVPLTDNPGMWAASIILPAASLVVATVASSAQQIRSAIKSVMERDWVRTLRSRGVPEREILFKHVLRSAAPAGCAAEVAEADEILALAQPDDHRAALAREHNDANVIATDVDASNGVIHVIDAVILPPGLDVSGL